MGQTDKIKLLNSVFLFALVSSMLIRLLPFLALVTDNTIVREFILDAMYLISLLLPAAAGRRIIGKTTKALIKKKLDLPFLWVFIAMGIITVAAYLNYAVVLPFKMTGLIGNVQYSPSVNSPTDLLLLILSSAVIPPIAEEIFFRGFLVKRLLPLGSFKAIIISAVMFSLFHANLAQLLYTFAAGLVFGYIYVLTGSIVPCILLHALNNGYSVAITAVNAFCGGEAATILSVCTDGFFLLSGGASLLYIFMKRRQDKSFCAMPEYRADAEPLSGFPVIALIYTAFTVLQIISTNFT